MAGYVNHHYVPKFLLERWHSGDDDKLSVFRWAHGKLDLQRHKAKSVAKMAHLYSFLNRHGEYDVQLEKKFFGPHIDDPAAAVHRAVLYSGLQQLTDEQHRCWTYFLVSLLIRTPDMIDRIRTVGKESLAREFDRDPEDYEAARGDLAASSVLELINSEDPTYLDSFGVRTLPQLIQMEQFTKRFIGGKTWILRGVRGAAHKLLIGDRPLLQGGSLEGEHLFGLPITPEHFFAVASGPAVAQRVTEMDVDELVGKVNDQTVRQADTWAYAVDDSQARFIANRLARPAVAQTRKQKQTPRGVCG